MAGRISALLYRVSSSLVKNRHRLPKVLNRVIDEVANNPDGIASRVASFALGGTRSANLPPPTSPPATAIRVYIGPTNYAAQGYLWSRALSGMDPAIGARNMAVELPGGFFFPADTSVPVAVYNRSTSWQQAELRAVEGFTHALFEAERPLFGSLFDRDVAREVQELTDAGVSCALICHGTDIRSPRDHMASNPWSPFFDDPVQTQKLQADADANSALLRSLGRPVFVSTPDLLMDVPSAVWCPVVIDPGLWTGGRPLFSRAIPVVAHIPSMGSTKGTTLIEPVLKRLHASGVIDYRSVTGVSSDRMPELIRDADIVLDQFRIGSYGVAACEAMAAGRLVIGHISAVVREKVRELTGVELPVLEADPSSLEGVLLDLIAEPQRGVSTASAGQLFVRTWHSGAKSALALTQGWISPR